MEWKLFLYYCAYCTAHDIAGKTYKEFFEDKELVAMIGLSYFQTIIKLNT